MPRRRKSARACRSHVLPPKLRSVEEANWDVDHDDYERWPFAQDFEKGIIYFWWFRREGGARQFGARDEPFVVERRDASYDRIGKVRTTMRTHEDIYTGMRLLSNCSKVRMSSLGRPVIAMASS